MSNAALEKIYDDRRLFGHPVGLGVLFLTEMWERFSYYGMRGLLKLYMVNYLFVVSRQVVHGCGATAARAQHHASVTSCTCACYNSGPFPCRHRPAAMGCNALAPTH